MRSYMSATRLHQAKDQGWELIGPAQPSANRSGLRSAFRIEAFNIDIAKRSARCPSGHLSTQCSRLKEAKRQKVSFRFEWSYQPLAECVLNDPEARSSELSSRLLDELASLRKKTQNHEALSLHHEQLLQAHQVSRERENATLQSACGWFWKTPAITRFSLPAWTGE
jgi:hypothetical protein